jgi:hypothetical protein
LNEAKPKHTKNGSLRQKMYIQLALAGLCWDAHLDLLEHGRKMRYAWKESRLVGDRRAQLSELFAPWLILVEGVPAEQVVL